MSITFYESNNERQERAARDQIAGRDRAMRNAAEWQRRSIAAQKAGDVHLAMRLQLQKYRELRPYR